MHFHIHEGRDSPLDFDWISGYYCEICLLLWLLLSVSPILQYRKFLFLNIAHQVIWLDFIAPQLSETVPYYLYFFNDFNTSSISTLGLEIVPFGFMFQELYEYHAVILVVFLVILLLAIITLVRSKILFYIAVFLFLASTWSDSPTNLTWFFAEDLLPC